MRLFEIPYGTASGITQFGEFPASGEGEWIMVMVMKIRVRSAMGDSYGMSAAAEVSLAELAQGADGGPIQI